MSKRIFALFLAMLMIFSVLPINAVAIDPEEAAKKVTKQAIQKGISTIPYIGSTASSLLGPTIGKILGIETGPSIDDVMNELEAIEEKLDEITAELDSIQDSINDLKGIMDSSTQSVLNQMFKDTTFSSFNDKLTSVTSTTVKMYNYIQLLYDEDDDYVTSDLYKTLKVAELLTDFTGNNASDYVNMVTALSKYIDGSQIAFANKRSLFENAYLSACTDSILGGEASIRVAPYLNEVTGALADAYKLIVIVLESKVYIADHYSDVKAACNEDSDAYDEDVAALVEFGLNSNYRDKGNARLWKQLISTEENSFCVLHNKNFGEEGSVVSRYNDMVNDRWFNYIRSCRIENGDITVDFVPLSNKLLPYYVTGDELWSRSGLGVATGAQNREVKIGDNLNMGISGDDIKKLTEHLLNNTNGVFVSGTGINVSKSMIDILRDYGFEVPDPHASSMPVLVKGQRYDIPSDVAYRGSAYVRSWANGCDMQIATTYNLTTGKSISALPDFKDYQYINYYYNYDNNPKDTWYNKDEYTLYFFQAADIDIYDTDDFVDFISLVAKGRPFINCTITLMNDIDLSDVQYTALWSTMTDDANRNGFRGTFNGNGHTIKGLTDTGDAHGAGLFRTLGRGAVVKDLILEDINIKSSNKNAGALAARVNSVYYSLQSKGYKTDGEMVIDNVQVKNSTIQATDNVGSLIGTMAVNKFTFNNCTSEATIRSNGTNKGGLVGSHPSVWYIEQGCTVNNSILAASMFSSANLAIIIVLAVLIVAAAIVYVIISRKKGNHFEYN